MILRQRDNLIIVVALAALATTAALWGWAWRLDRLVYDLGLTLWQRPPPPGIVIVAIDDHSIEAIGRWPWPRAVHATLLQRLATMRPRAVALDLLLSESDADPQQDRLLARSLARAAPVVLPVARLTAGVGRAVVLVPAKPLRSVVHLGAAEAAVDSDGVLRHAFLHTGTAAARYPHMALALLDVGGEVPHTRLSPVAAPTVTAGARGSSRDGRLLIRYAGPPGTIERISYVDILRGDVPAERLTGRYALVGMTAQGLGDTLATPVNGRHRAMPGVEVLANTLYTLRSGDTINELEPYQVAVLSAGLLSVLVLVAFGSFGTRMALLTAVVSVPMAVAASLFSLRSGVWCSPVPYSLAAILAYPLWSWRRLERTVVSLDSEIARIAIDPMAMQGAYPAAPESDGDALDARLRVLQRAGKLVRDARSFLAEAVAALPTAMLVGDEKARVVLANPKAAALFDVESSAELTGLDLIRLLAEFSAAQSLDWAGTLAGLCPASGGVAVEARLGDNGDFVIHMAAVDLQGVRRLIVTIADIEPIKQAQREREEVLAFVSHDLRSPATSIVLLVDLNLRSDVQTPLEPLLHEIRRLATRTLEMSEDFVRVAQVQTRVLQRLPVPPRALVDAALADLGAQAMASGVNLHVRADNADSDVAVDAPLVVRAIGNLVSNAIKHSPRGGHVELQVSVDGALLRLTVRDDGPGLTPQQMQQVAQGDSGAAVRDAHGVGLGLLFVQRVARRHGGALRAVTLAQGGSALFELVLPA